MELYSRKNQNTQQTHSVHKQEVEIIKIPTLMHNRASLTIANLRNFTNDRYSFVRFQDQQGDEI